MGTVVKTHGVRGELKIRPSCDSPAFLAQFSPLLLNGTPYTVESSRAHKDSLLVKLKGVDSVETAMSLIGSKVDVSADAARAALPEGRHFISDLIGCQVVSLDGENVGQLTDVLTLPAHDVYVVKGDKTETLIPVVDAFIKSTDMTTRTITVQLIEGLTHETL